ncbi:conserved hypothetical protein [Lactobacillus acetotolerans]|uniref:DUF3278 domain-containing protein n=1 Tax=Lactobacillus acetotolerans TaxID=1600 RepID=A0A0D6A220_9LACO|nr:DUF3278 domain-containing protein [Lactobacillus acetotolerans]BAQ56709.1 conserved hypothetical protein [Lactobacillus acetotolerans]
MKNWKNKLMQNYLGYPGKRDEYQKSKINEILANDSMLSYYLIVVLMLISFIWDIMHQTITVGTMLLFVAVYFNSAYLTFKLKKYRVLETEFTNKEKYKAALKNAKYRSFWSGIFFGFTMLVLNCYIFPLLSNEALETGWLVLFKSGICLLAGLAFGFCMYFMMKNKIKFIKDDE